MSDAAGDLMGWRRHADRFRTLPAPAALVEGMPPHVRAVVDRLAGRGFETVAVGGGVRDALLGRADTGLWDLATAAAPSEAVLAFPHAVPTGIAHGTVTLPSPLGAVEVTSYRTDHGYTDARRPDEVRFGVDLWTDLTRRDFTVNALAYEPASGLVLDSTTGLDDLAARLLRAVGDPATRFREDALRPLRAARLAAVLGFAVEERTRQALGAVVDLVPRLSAERVREELSRMLTAPAPSVGLRLLDEAGLLALTLPELAQAKGVTQNRHHDHDVFEHTLRAVDFAPSDRPLVRWAALLHDLGKPATRALKPDGEASFHGHAQVGAEIADALLERLRFARAEREAIVLLVREHLFDYRAEWSDAAVRRFLRRVGEERLDDLFALRVADARATRDEPPHLAGLRALQERIAHIAAQRPALAARDLAIDGRDVMAALALAPGPAVGEVLERLLERVLDDPALNTRERLLALARAEAEPDGPRAP